MTEQTVPEELVEPEDPAAWALARHIADHPVSTIQVAFRYLNAPISIELHEVPELDHGTPEPGPLCSDNPTCDGECCGRNTPTPAPVPADVREQIAEAIRSGALFDLGTHVMGYAGEIADAVLRVPAIAEALAAVAAVADIARGYCADCGRGDAAPTAEQWLQERRRAEQTEDLLRVAHDTSNRSEAERARAVQRAEEAERRIANLQSSYATLTEMARNFSERAIENGKRAEKAEAEVEQLRAELTALKRPCPGCRICTAPCPR